MISFEGVEASGKTTQMARLAERLREAEQAVVTTREPHDDAIRSLLQQKGADYDPLTQVFLFAAARRQHIKDVIQPALDQGKIVLCDRFIDSTLAYQGYGLGVPLDLVRLINQQATGGLIPDISFIFDLDVDAQRARLEARGEALTSYEKLERAFHEKVCAGFLAIARAAPERCLLLDARRSQDRIAEDIWSHLR